MCTKTSLCCIMSSALRIPYLTMKFKHFTYRKKAIVVHRHFLFQGVQRKLQTKSHMRTNKWNWMSDPSLKQAGPIENDVINEKWRHKMLTSPGLRIDLFSFLGADQEIALRNKTRFLGTRWSQKSWKGGKSQVICLFCRE